MFDEFRQTVKKLARAQKLTYALIAQRAGIKESTVKYFMCGANDSRRTAEKLADVLGIKIVYSKGEYSTVEDKRKD
ncbi:MAG: helix-turn-helix transcriptional regulator [Ruminococcus sp.]|nr:helix-turn-helix transcriptional regulator [Ruminococcus sp.]